MAKKTEPNWQPIRNLPLIASMIDGQVSDAKEQYSTLLEARPKPHVLDDAIIYRTIRVYTEQLDFAEIFEKQLSKWQAEERLTSIQQNEINRLHGQVQQLRKHLTDILALAEELKTGTIKKIMAKIDLEMGIEFLKKLGEW